MGGNWPDTEQAQWKACELSLKNYKYALSLLPNIFFKF